MLRHTALFLHRDTIQDGQRLAMLRRLAFLRMECDGVRAGDYGQDLFGGSSPLLAVPPWKRAPRWRAAREGPPCNYDVALHLDFDDEAGFAGYLADDNARAVDHLNAGLTVPDLTARIDWRYDGAPLIRRGRVRHTALFVWAAAADAGARSRALDAARSLAGAPAVMCAVAAENVGARPANFDWIFDAQLEEEPAARGFVSGARYANAMSVIAQATQYEWTARVTHLMRGY
jgi:hypothetical protein